MMQQNQTYQEISKLPSDYNKLDYDLNWSQTLLKKVDGNSRYQLLLFIHFGTKWILAGMIIFCLNFIYIQPKFTCSSQELQGYSSCEQFVCSSKDPQFWKDHFQYPVYSSIILDYDIVMMCSNKWISSFLQFYIFLGSFFGELGMAHMADNHGRKSTQAYSWLATIMGLVIMICSINLQLIALGTFLTGLGINAATNLHYTFLKQFLLGKNRQVSIVALQILFSLGIAMIALCSYLIISWRSMIVIFLLVPSIILYYNSSIIQETTHFSLQRSKSTLLDSLNRIAKINKANQLKYQDLDIIRLQTQKIQYSMKDLFRYKSLRQITIICGIVNFIIQFMYDSTILSLDKIGMDVHINQFIIGIVEMIGACFSSYIIIVVKRKQFTIIAMFISSILTLILGLVQNESQQSVFYEILLMGLLRFTLNCGWGVFFVYAAQLFPSDVTSLSLGLISGIGTIGAFISPFIRLLTAKNTMYTMSLMCFIVLPLLRRLPQTKGVTLKQKIQQQQIIQSTSQTQILIKKIQRQTQRSKSKSKNISRSSQTQIQKEILRQVKKQRQQSQQIQNQTQRQALIQLQTQTRHIKEQE